MDEVKNNEIIWRHNDAFRCHFGACEVDGVRVDGQVKISQGIAKLTDGERHFIIGALVFVEWDKCPDPSGERNFGVVRSEKSENVIWQIDYFADIEQTQKLRFPLHSEIVSRLLTLRLSSEDPPS